MRLSGSVAALTLVLISTACEREPSYTRVEPPSAAAPSPEFTGTLPSSMDTGGTAYYDFLQTVRRGPKKTVQMCTGFWSCRRKTNMVNVVLEPVLYSYTVDPRRVPRYGAVVLIARNTGGDETQHYKMRPGPYVYTWKVVRNTGDTTKSHWALNETDTTTHLTRTVTNDGGRYFPCLDRPPATTDEVGLYECGEAHETAPATKTSGLGALEFLGTLWSAFQFELYPEPPDWKSCPAGCCTLAEY